MKKNSIHTFKNIILSVFFVLFLFYLILFAVDRIYGKSNKTVTSSDSLTISCGDIIFKETSFIMAFSKNPQYGCFPGHLAIILNDTAISTRNYSIENLLVAESSAFDIKNKEFVPTLKIGSADNNFGYAHGRLLLIKTHLDENQKKKLLLYTNYNLGKPYKLLAQKNDTIYFNCSSFVWNAFKNVTKTDIDADGGSYVLPADVLSYFIREKSEIIRF